MGRGAAEIGCRNRQHAGLDNKQTHQLRHSWATQTLLGTHVLRSACALHNRLPHNHRLPHNKQIRAALASTKRTATGQHQQERQNVCGWQPARTTPKFWACDPDQTCVVSSVYTGTGSCKAPCTHTHKIQLGGRMGGWGAKACQSYVLRAMRQIISAVCSAAVEVLERNSSCWLLGAKSISNGA